MIEADKLIIEFEQAESKAGEDPDKAFKNLLFWFALYTVLFCIGVVFAVGADIK